MVRPCCARVYIHFFFVLIQRKVTKEKSRAGVFGAIRIKPLAAGAKNSLRSNIRSFPAPGKILTYAPTPRPLAMRMVTHADGASVGAGFACPLVEQERETKTFVLLVC